MYLLVDLLEISGYRIDELFCFDWFGSQNALHLEEKEKREKQMRLQIIEEAEEYIRGFYDKRKLNIETNIATNREREKVKVSARYSPR